MYFAAELTKAQAIHHVFDRVGIYLDYYILYVNDKDILNMDLRIIDPIPLTKDEAESYAFCNSFDKGYVKIPEDSWKELMFDRNNDPSYEKTDSGKIKYFINEKDQKNATELMTKILKQKVQIFIDNKIIFEENNKNYWLKVFYEYLTMLDRCETIGDATRVLIDIQSKLYKENPEDWE